MRTRLLRRASIGALALTLIGATAAIADGISADADNDVLASPHANGVTANQAIGSSALYDFDALISNTGNANNDVLPAGSSETVTVAVTAGGGWLKADPATPSSLTFSSYDSAQGGQVRITVPCDVEAGTKATTSIVLQGTASNGKPLNPNQVTLSYAITATADTADVCAPADVAPAVAIDSVDPSGDEGSPILLKATVTDDGASTLTLAWTYQKKSGADDGASCSFGSPTSEDTTITCTDDGVYTATLTATDAVGSDSGAVDVTVDNVAPVITSASFGTSNLSCGTDNASLVVSFTDAGSNDTHSVAVDWNNDGTYDETVNDATTGVSIPHTYGAGVHTAALKVIDDNLGFATASAGTKVNYQMSGILQPINTTGSRSLFKYGSTIPVKIQILGCDGLPVTGLAPTLSVRMSSSDPISGVDESIGSTSSADTGSLLRYSGDGGIYIYNLATKSLGDPTAGYQATVTIPETGQYSQATFGLKK
jgi:hypothetical protein